ncbi:RagB/SusD family nutrient uptake outer membrane protein [Pedobacter sp. N23S346]|uniref:RagB/SusD family nutrient uptake outer membrane protein n=1 Tax=Pedobacter sp. N23S346 TaxID=3402750 RepID=UPI003AC26F96
MMFRSINKIISACLLVTIMLSACEKTVEIDPPVNEITDEQVFSSDRLAASALAGIYTGMAQSSAQSTIGPVNYSLFADDLTYVGSNTTLFESFGNAYSTISSIQTTVFSEWYTIIYRANAVIEGLQKYQGTSNQVKKQFTAEAKVIRAYCYFNLINSFGDVPLILETNAVVTATQPRETVSNIYTQIIADLTVGKSDLPADYAASSSTRLGVNKFVATALLARVYLFMGNYTEAESNASEVIASSLYSLIPSANMATGVWTKNNAESIWQMSSPLNPVNQYTVEGSNFIPLTATIVPQYNIRASFLQQFESTDLRLRNWTRQYAFGTGTVTLPYKYKYPNNLLAVAAAVVESPTVLRLAEQYLIRAEARARIGTNLQGALSDLNRIRARAQTTLSASATSTALLNETLAEFRKEFFCEQSHRWFNIKRLGQADAILSAIKTGYRPEAKLLPIPTAAIDANPNLTQNPGYQ